MLALQSAPLHLRDQDKQERRFDQPLLFTSYLHHQTSSTSSTSSLSARHHSHHPRHHSYHHPTPPSVSAVAAVAAAAAAAACAVPALMPHSHQQPQQSHHLANKQALFYRESDLKQDLSIANAKAHHHHPYHINIHNNNNTSSINSNGIHKNVAVNNHLTPLSGTTWAPRIQNDDNAASASAAQTPIHKMEARIAQMTIEDCAKEKIVLLLT
ncbi:hypothetical protein BGZ96_003721, partial [Linnemannia gamsii]